LQLNLAQNDHYCWSERFLLLAPTANKVRELEQKGKIKVVNGVVVDTKNNLGFTGDYDIFDILTPDGKPISPKKREAVLKDLFKEPVAAQHGYHMEWNATTDIDKQMKQKIIDSHKKGGEALADFNPDGTVGGNYVE
jgi:hypothetical protein